MTRSNSPPQSGSLARPASPSRSSAATSAWRKPPKAKDCAPSAWVDRITRAPCEHASGALALDQVPLVAVEVAEHHDATVRLLTRLLGELDAVRAHVRVVADEVARVQEEEHAA